MSFIVVAKEGETGLKAYGPFVSLDSAGRFWTGTDQSDQAIIMPMIDPELEGEWEIGEVSDLLQGLAKASAMVYESNPTMKEFVSLRAAIMYIVEAIDEEEVREYMLRMLNGRL